MATRFNTLTRLKTYTIEAGKKTLYLVLKKKPLPVEIMEKLNKDFQKILEKYVDKIIPDLIKLNPKNPEKMLQYISLQITLKILDKIINESYFFLSEKDRILAEKIYNHGIEREKQNQDEKKIIDDNQQDENINETNDFKSNYYLNSID